jgi:hypothetical protein
MNELQKRQLLPEILYMLHVYVNIKHESLMKMGTLVVLYSSLISFTNGSCETILKEKIKSNIQVHAVRRYLLVFDNFSPNFEISSYVKLIESHGNLTHHIVSGIPVVIEYL